MSSMGFGSQVQLGVRRAIGRYRASHFAPLVVLMALLGSMLLLVGSPQQALAAEEGINCATLTPQQIETLKKQENLYAEEILVKCGVLHGGASAGPSSAPSSVLGPSFPGSDINLINGTEGKAPYNTQAESFVWSHGSTIVVAYNDRRGLTETPPNRSGISVSKDGGATFTRLGPPAPLRGHGENRGDPIVVYDNKLGKWFAGDLVGECSGGIALWTSTEGETWNEGACVTNTSSDRESMWVDNNSASPHYGRMYISFNNFGAGAAPLEVTHSDNGTTWSTPVKVSGSEFRRDVQISGSPGSDGIVFLVGLSEGTAGLGSTQQNYMYLSTNGGESWTSETTMGPTYTMAGATECGGLPVVPPNWRSAGKGEPAVGPSDVLQFVYAGHGAGSDESDIYYVRSTNNGATWSTPLKLNTDSSTRAQWQPSLRVTPSGVVEASWYDRRNTTTEEYQRYARVSPNNGETWGPDEPLSTRIIPQAVNPAVPCFAGDYNYGTANENTGFDTWTDGRVELEGSHVMKVFFHSIALEATPTVTKVQPNEGPEAGGTSVTITGTHFTGATAVKFGTVEGTKLEVKSDTSISVTSPAHAVGTVDVTVTTPHGTSGITSADHYTYRAKPTVTNVQPNAGVPSGGTTVMISGTSFTAATGVKFGSTNAPSFTMISETWISAVSPAGTGTADVTVTTAGGTSVTGSADHFTYRSGGVVLGWGTNGAGELGDGTTTGPELCGTEPCSTIPVAATGPLSEASAVSAGVDHSLAALSNGSVMAWGANFEGQLGNGTTISSSVPVKVSSITTATAVSAGNEFSVALLKNGTVNSWGFNSSGQLGNGTTTNSSTPVAVSGLTEATAISAGETHGLALLKNGTVMAWGANGVGELGNGTTTNSSTPVKVSNITEAVAISAGGEYSLAVLKNGTVMSWGYNGAGQLGNGTTTNSSVPVKVSNITEVVSVSAGSAHAGALLKTGTVMSWGANQSGQLGNGTCCEQSTVPVKVSNMTEATSIADGFHSLAMLKSGTVQDWGRNSDGQLGVGTFTGPETCETRACSKIPVTVSGLSGATSIEGGVNYALAVGIESLTARPSVANVQPNAGVPSGGTTVMISGTSFTGATAVKFGATNAASFSVISGTWISAVSPAGSGTVDIAVTTAGGTSVAVSGDHFTYRSGGTSLGWGDNSAGELGDGTTTGPETCGTEACSRIPVAASGPVSATAVSAGQDHSLALLSAGTVKAWGANSAGELGNGTNTNSDVPVNVSNITTATAVSAGNEYSLALLKNGTVNSWGFNGSGQLGNGTTTSSNVPVAVSGITEATAISAGESHGLALLKNGSVMAWGANGAGELGNGTTTNSSVPVKVSNITEAVAISAGGEYSLAVLKNGTVMSWGYNGAGQLGNGTTTNSSVPVKVSSLSEVVSVAAGSAHALALLKGGTVKSWGANQSGQLGNGTCCEQSTVPVKVSNMTEATAISAGFHSLAMLRNGTVQDWGRNSVGQLGDGTNTGPETCEYLGSPRSCSKIPVAVSSLTGAIGIDGGVNYALAVGL